MIRGSVTLSMRSGLIKRLPYPKWEAFRSRRAFITECARGDVERIMGRLLSEAVFTGESFYHFMGTSIL